jgi:hypothetical protein
MSHEDLATRARQRSTDEGLHSWSLCPGSLYMVKSRKGAPGSFHLVSVLDGRAQCECLGAQYRGGDTRAHAQAVLKRLEREGLLPQSAPVQLTAGQAKRDLWG